MLELWSYIKEYNPIILSAPWILPNGNVDKSCDLGKRNWIAKFNLEPYDTIITPVKKVHSAPKHILIDDMKKYLEPWGERGIAIKHTSSAETKKVLEGILKKDN